jgi:hypothetical protein
MTGTPLLKVEQADEPIKDSLGQLWSPATIVVEWAEQSGQAAQLEQPSIRVRVVAPYRPDMTVEELRQAHKTAALDVLSSALIALEEPATRMQEPSRSEASAKHER